MDWQESSRASSGFSSRRRHIGGPGGAIFHGLHSVNSSAQRGSVFRSDRLLFSYPREGHSAQLSGELCSLENQRLMSPLLPFPRDPATIAARIRSSHPAPFTGAPSAYELAISEDGDDEAHIGIAGLYSISFEHSTAELGVSILRPDAQGRGLGMEAHRRWVTYAFEDLGLERLTGTAKATNQPALGVAESLGMSVEGTLRSHRFVAGRRVDITLLGLLRDEWEESRET